MTDQINWFPGHMRKALNDLSNRLKLADVIIEVCDARIPQASRNPELSAILAGKPRIIALNKSDFSDPVQNRLWVKFLRSEGCSAVMVDSIHRRGLDQIRKIAEEMCVDKVNQARAKGRIFRPIRVIVVGIPNSGKSTLINSFCNRKIAVTGDTPGLTRHFQWGRTEHGMELMDMPGVLWPNLGNRKNKLCLSLTGAIRSDITDSVAVASLGLSLVASFYPDLIYSRYGIHFQEGPYDQRELEGPFLKAARARGCILSGNRVDEERFARLFIDDFQHGRIGKISLEHRS